VKRLAAALALMLAVAACGQRVPGSKSAAVEGPDQGSFNWDTPEPDGLFMTVTDLSSIESSLPFSPIEPRLDGFLHIDATDPSKVDMDGRLLLFFYEDPTYGRVIVKEQLNRISLSTLEGLLVYNNDEASPVTFSLVNLNDGTEALVKVQKAPSVDGLAPNSVEFIESSVDVTIFGPDKTFSSDAAVKVANLVTPVK